MKSAYGIGFCFILHQFTHFKIFQENLLDSFESLPAFYSADQFAANPYFHFSYAVKGH